MLKLDVKGGISNIPSIIVVIGAVVAAINYFTSAITLPPNQAQLLATIVVILLALATFLTNVKGAFSTE